MRHSIFKKNFKAFCFSAPVIVIFTLAFAVCASASTETITYNYYDTLELKKTAVSDGAMLEYEYDDSGNRLSQIIITAKPAISASPSSLNFSLMTVGATSTESVLITNTGNWTLEIEGIGISGANSTEFSAKNDTCSGQSLAPSASCTLIVVFSPSSGGSKTAILDIASNAPDNADLQVTLNGSATTAQMYPLTIVKDGTGSGTITTDTGSLTWSDNTGTVSYTPGTNVNISALAGTDSIFEGWAGACSGNGSSCSAHMSSAVNVSATFNRKADFSATPLSGMAPLAVQFTDLSISPSSWAWNFGDNSTSTSQNPLHTYTTPGYYTVSLTAGGATMTKNYYVTVWSCTNQTVKISGTLSYYSTIQNAYNVTPDGDAVQMMALEFPESLNLQSPNTVTLQGGYGCDFSSNPWYSTINGALTINGGPVIIENVIIK
jgi:hypothetical protein